MLSPADRIKQMIAREFGVYLSVVNDDTHFRDHLLSGGHEMMALEDQCEEAFGIRFESANFEFETVGELIALVEDKLAAREKAA